MSKVRNLDLIKFFIVNWLLGLLATFLLGLVWTPLYGQAMSTTKMMISTFGYCILFMLMDIWKEIKEAKQNGE